MAFSSAKKVSNKARQLSEIKSITSYVGLPSPIDFNGMVRQYYQRQTPYMADLRLILLDKTKREHQSHAIVLRLREQLSPLNINGINIKVVEVISGGPAWRGEHVEVGDIIMKVKQADEEDPVSIVGMRIDDAVKLIKGPKGTKVTLTIKRVDGTVEEETITRDVVELGETYAKSALIKKEERNFGLINLPAFYFTMEDYEERNAAADVKKEILRLKEQGMEGLVLD